MSNSREGQRSSRAPENNFGGSEFEPGSSSRNPSFDRQEMNNFGDGVIGDVEGFLSDFRLVSDDYRMVDRNVYGEGSGSLCGWAPDGNEIDFMGKFQGKRIGECQSRDVETVSVDDDFIDRLQLSLRVSNSRMAGFDGENDEGEPLVSGFPYGRQCRSVGFLDDNAGSSSSGGVRNSLGDALGEEGLRLRKRKRSEEGSSNSLATRSGRRLNQELDLPRDDVNTKLELAIRTPSSDCCTFRSTAVSEGFAPNKKMRTDDRLGTEDLAGNIQMSDDQLSSPRVGSNRIMEFTLFGERLAVEVTGEPGPRTPRSSNNYATNNDLDNDTTVIPVDILPLSSIRRDVSPYQSLGNDNTTEAERQENENLLDLLFQSHESSPCSDIFSTPMYDGEYLLPFSEVEMVQFVTEVSNPVEMQSEGSPSPSVTSPIQDHEEAIVSFEVSDEDEMFHEEEDPLDVEIAILLWSFDTNNVDADNIVEYYSDSDSFDLYLDELLDSYIGIEEIELDEEQVSKFIEHHKFASGDDQCCICQEEYAEGDDMGKLECGHDFHVTCIKQWLRRKLVCPLCRRKLQTKTAGDTLTDNEDTVNVE